MHLVQLGHLLEEQLGLAIEFEGFQELPLSQFQVLLAEL